MDAMRDSSANPQRKGSTATPRSSAVAGRRSSAGVGGTPRSGSPNPRMVPSRLKVQLVRAKGLLTLRGIADPYVTIVAGKPGRKPLRSKTMPQTLDPGA